MKWRWALYKYIVYIEVSPPPPPTQKNHPLFQVPPKSTNCPSLAFLGNPLLCIGFSWTSPLCIPLRGNFLLGGNWVCNLFISILFIYLFKSLFTFGKFCSSDPSFNGNILISLYLKSETTAHAQLFSYLFIHTIYKFHGMVSAGSSHWGYLLINRVYR